LIPVTITPDMAKGYLSFGVSMEGEIDQTVIDDYAQTMQDGEWKAGSILIFSKDYKIIDGYYRLAAVAQSGVAAEFYRTHLRSFDEHRSR
jgi:5-methylthioribose kinase